MIHDFETLVSRKNTGSGKWDEMTKEHPNLPENVAPLSIADMELKNPPEIVEGLKKYIDTHILGYTGPTEEYFDAVCGWMKRRNDWDIKKEEIVSTHGVVTVLAVSVLAYTDPGDGVITMPPVYYPFRMTIEHNNRKNVECPLINTNETYTIDFDLFEKLCAEEKNKMFIFCNPHNPVGRVWTEEEIAKLGAICAKHNVIVVSDEIHSDLIMLGHKHVAFANACKDALPKYLVCTAPSKTFNLATLQTSNIIIPDEELRTKFQSILQQHFTPSAGALGLEACRLGYMAMVAVGAAVDYLLHGALKQAGIDLHIELFCGLLVTVWLIINELISVLENLAAIGVPGFPRLNRLLSRLKNTVNEKEDEHDV